MNETTTVSGDKPQKNNYSNGKEPSTPEEIQTANEQFWSRLVEQRREGRIDFRTTGNAYSLGDSGINPISRPTRFWTIDVSTTGALVRTQEPLLSKRLLIEIFMPQLASSYIEVEIVRQSEDSASLLKNKNGDCYLYGLQFSRMIKKEAVKIEDGITEAETSSEDKALLGTQSTVERLNGIAVKTKNLFSRVTKRA